MTIEYYVVGLKRPGGATVADVEDYVEDWVASGKGSRHPGDPLSNLNGETVSCRRVTRHRLERLLAGMPKPAKKAAAKPAAKKAPLPTKTVAPPKGSAA